MNSLLFLIFVSSCVQEMDSLEMDPELQLCQDQSLDAAVVADDNVGYAFKGNYFWQLSTTSGISPNFIARYISDRWKGLTGPIDAAFTIEESTHKLCTVFLKGNQWFLYQMENLLGNGTTDNWPGIKQPPVLSAVEIYNNTIPRKDFVVYLLYTGDQFSKYLFNDINKPNLLVSGQTYRKGKFMYFMYDPTDKVPGTLMSELIAMNAIISDDKGFVIYGDKEFCIAKMDEIPLCEKKNDSKYFGCTRSEFSMTTNTEQRTAMSHTGRDVTDEVNHIPTEMNSNNWPPEEVIPTEEIKDEPEKEDFPTEEISPAVGTDVRIESDKKSNKSVVIIVIVVVVIFCLIIGFVIFFFARNRNKKSDQDNSKELSIDSKDGKIINKMEVSPTSQKPSSIENTTTLSKSSGSETTAKPSQSSPKHPSNVNTVTKTADNKTKIASEADQMIDAIKSEEDI